jgi:hypothetical protein
MFLCSTVEVTAAYLAFWLPALRAFWKQNQLTTKFFGVEAQQSTAKHPSHPFLVNVRRSFEVASGEADSVGSETELRQVVSVSVVHPGHGMMV